MPQAIGSQADSLASPGLLPETEDLDVLFASLDTNKYGKLSWEETLAFFARKGVAQSQARHIFAKVDVDQNGTLDRAEFRRLYKVLKNGWWLSPYPRAPPPPPLDVLLGAGATRLLAAALVAAVAAKAVLSVARA